MECWQCLPGSVQFPEHILSTSEALGPWSCGRPQAWSSWAGGKAWYTFS